MAGPRLTNYLRPHRKRCGLSQGEVAFLLGCRSGSKVSAFERGVREPKLRTLLAFTLLYELPLEDLYAELFAQVRRELARRTRLLAQRWQEATPPGKERDEPPTHFTTI